MKKKKLHNGNAHMNCHTNRSKNIQVISGHAGNHENGCSFAYLQFLHRKAYEKDIFFAERVICKKGNLQKKHRFINMADCGLFE